MYNPDYPMDGNFMNNCYQPQQQTDNYYWNGGYSSPFTNVNQQADSRRNMGFMNPTMPQRATNAFSNPAFNNSSFGMSNTNPFAMMNGQPDSRRNMSNTNMFAQPQQTNPFVTLNTTSNSVVSPFNTTQTPASVNANPFAQQQVNPFVNTNMNASPIANGFNSAPNPFAMPQMNMQMPNASFGLPATIEPAVMSLYTQQPVMNPMTSRNNWCNQYVQPQQIQQPVVNWNTNPQAQQQQYCPQMGYPSTNKSWLEIAKSNWRV